MVDLREQAAQRYGANTLKRSAMNIRGGAGVFERVLSGKGYKTVIEIGTYRGVSAAEMARYVDRVATFDLKRGRIEQLGEKFDRHAFWSSLGVSNIDLHLVDDDAEKAAIIAALEFDFAFIDGAHDAESVAFDFELVKRCGRVLFHDYDLSGAKNKDCVYDFVNTLPNHQVQVHDIFALWTNS
jgi:predicted O-methyltransferase YrrM